MMKKFSILFVLGLVWIAFSCSSISVNYDYDPGTDFNKFQTYQIYEDPIEGDALTKNPLVRKRVFSGIEKALAAKGYTKSESDDADFLVVTHAGIKDRMQVTDWGGYGWYRPGWGYYGGGYGGGYTNVSYYEEANVVVNIVNLEKDELAWRGVATGTLSDPPRDQEKWQKRIDDTMAKILKNFPPSKK
jgi:hypothetical protein